jgi:Leucine-rich repeat (LRR) protein
MRASLWLMVMGALLLWTTPARAQDFDGEAEALRLIEQARVSGTTNLNLYGLGLERLPPELWALTNLQVLYLSGNQLTSVPAELGNLTALQILYVGYNQLTSLPAEIGNLTALKQLNLVPRHYGNWG